MVTNDGVGSGDEFLIDRVGGGGVAGIDYLGGVDKVLGNSLLGRNEFVADGVFDRDLIARNRIGGGDEAFFQASRGR